MNLISKWTESGIWGNISLFPSYGLVRTSVERYIADIISEQHIIHYNNMQIKLILTKDKVKIQV